MTWKFNGKTQFGEIRLERQNHTIDSGGGGGGILNEVKRQFTSYHDGVALKLRCQQKSVTIEIKATASSVFFFFKYHVLSVWSCNKNVHGSNRLSLFDSVDYYGADQPQLLVWISFYSVRDGSSYIRRNVDQILQRNL